jgi:hypothetical protein
MKVAKLYRFHNIRIEDVPIQRIGPRDAILKTKADIANIKAISGPK